MDMPEYVQKYYVSKHKPQDATFPKGSKCPRILYLPETCPAMTSTRIPGTQLLCTRTLWLLFFNAQ